MNGGQSQNATCFPVYYATQAGSSLHDAVWNAHFTAQGRQKDDDLKTNSYERKL